MFVDVFLIWDATREKLNHREYSTLHCGSPYSIYLHTYIHIRTYTYIHTYIHTYTHTYTHTHTHTYTLTYTHTYTHTYMQMGRAFISTSLRLILVCHRMLQPHLDLLERLRQRGSVRSATCTAIVMAPSLHWCVSIMAGGVGML